MRGKAAVSFGEGEFTFEEVMYDKIGKDEVIVDVKAVGICHTDIASTKSIYPFTYPVILGHEGAGIIERKGSNIKDFEVGDHVVLSYSRCNNCQSCNSEKPYICESFYPLNTHGFTYDNKKKMSLANGKKISNFFGQSSFAEYALVHKNNLIKVSKHLPLEYLGPLSCGIMTGFGAVFEKLKPSKGESIVVFGCGTVGLSSIIASKLSECSTIVAVDINDKKLEYALQLGATHIINSKNQDVLKEINKINKTGIDYAVESTGIPKILTEIMECLKMPGEVVVLTAAKQGCKIEIDYKSIQAERKVMGTVMGSVNPKRFIPMLIKLYEEGKLPLEKIITFYPFEKINEAIQEIETGKTIKAVLKI